MSTVLFEDNNLTIIYYEDRDYLFVKWNGLIGGDTFRSLAGNILDAIDKTKTQRVLSDNTHWKVIAPNDHGWAANNWFPQAEAKGVKMLATVLSKDYFNRAAEKAIENLAEVENMEIKNFHSADEAFVWLLESTN